MSFFITPQGRLRFDSASAAAQNLPEKIIASLRTATITDTAPADAPGDIISAQILLALGTTLLDAPLPSDAAYWRQFTRRYLTALCQLPETTTLDELARAELAAPPPDTELASQALAAPPMPGAEYLTAETLATLWRTLDAHARRCIQKTTTQNIASWLRSQNPAWHLVGRVTLHLAENKRDQQHPFAFLATYTHRITDQAKPQYLPLGRALQEYAGARQHDALLSLLAPVQRAAERSPLIRELVETQRIFHPQAWTAPAAYRLLRDIPALEESGLLVRIPDWWHAGQAARPRVTITIGGKKKGGIGLDALLDFNLSVTLDGAPLTDEEWARIASAESGLVMLKGRWVEIDREKLQHVLDHWKKLDRSRRDGLTFAESLRLLAGAAPGSDTPEAASDDIREWTRLTPGQWLSDTLATLRDPERAAAHAAPPPGLDATLRPYQLTGVAWMRFLTQLGLGACLADDMGLGKTMQILALLQHQKNEIAATPAAHSSGQAPALVVCPASLLGNWRAEAVRFAPALRILAIHPSETPAEKLAALAATPPDKLPEALAADADLVLTTYGMLLKQNWLRPVPWRLVILDEAQAIKNPSARQTRAVKELRAPARIALTGTPVENNLGDLWSLFDFLNPGLLGAAAHFGRYTRALAKNTQPGAYAPLRQIVRPYILRRLKTDRAIIADLPDKTEVTAHCALTKKQTVLYAEIVRDLAAKLEAARDESGRQNPMDREQGNTPDMRRRGLILATLLRLKQLCNHPAQLTAAGDYAPADSGKFQRLAEICAEIASRQEKALIFTQFRELTAPLQHHLATVFGRPGLVLHGSVPVKERRALVEQFQQDDGPPCFILSLKAGGTGLTLTQAAHVIHFDRWWNPAVENQATDRAYRIGQKKNVLVHKFVCRGTLEEKIDALIAGKKQLSEEILGSEAGGETLLTEMRDDELLKFVSLDLRAALGE